MAGQYRHMIAGKPVIDSRERLEIEITADDVRKGERRSQAECAAARSIKRTIPGAKGARVCLGRTYVDMGNHWMIFETPSALRSEIIAHDRDGKFDPGSYFLRPIRPSGLHAGKRQGSDKPGARDKGSKDRTPKKSREKHHVIRNVRAWGANV